MYFADKKDLEQAIADKLNEIADLFGSWGGYDASKLSLGIGDDRVWAFIYEKDGNPLDFRRERKHRKAQRMFTPELGEIIGKAAKECLMNDKDNPLCWASDEGVELMRQKLIFRLQQHDFMLDLKEGGTVASIEKVGEKK